MHLRDPGDPLRLPLERLIVRPGRAADAAQVLAINAAGTPGVTPLSPQELDDIGGAAALYLITAIGDQIGAYVIGLASDAAYDGDEFRWFRAQYAERFLYIDQVAVAEDWRGRGVGSLLYRELEVRTRDCGGIPRIVCELNLDPPNLGSARFHDHHGYTQVGTLVTSDGRFVSLRCKILERESTSASERR
jgi:uncharacterized protein